MHHLWRSVKAIAQFVSRLGKQHNPPAKTPYRKSSAALRQKILISLLCKQIALLGKGDTRLWGVKVYLTVFSWGKKYVTAAPQLGSLSGI